MPTVTGAKLYLGGTLLSGGGSQSAVERLNSALAAAATQPVRVAFAGSSTTQGVGASTAAARYVNRLVAAMQAAYPASNGYKAPVLASISATFGAANPAPGVHGYNAGEGNTDSVTYLTQTEIDAIGALDPRVMVHMVGSNDYANGVPIATFKANVLAKIAALDTATAGPCVQVLVQSFQRMDVGAPAIPWAEYGKALAEIAAADPTNVMFVDVNGLFVPAGVPGADLADLVGADNLHATDAGHQLLAEGLRVGLRIPPPVPGATLASDDFNRADNAASLGTAPSGQTWTTDGVFSIANNKTRWVSGNGHAVLAMAATDVDISTDVTWDAGYATTSSMGINAHYTDGGNRLVFYVQGTIPRLAKVVGGTLTELWAGTAVTVAGTTHTLRLVSKGSAVTVYIDGVQMTAYTLTAPEVTSFKSVATHGLRGNTAAAAFDNFVVKATS